MQWIFYGGVLADEDIAQLKLDSQEVKFFEFVDIESTHGKHLFGTRKRVGPRVVMALQALHQNTTYYLENSQQII